MMRFELMTSSLPRKRSTPELHRHLFTIADFRFTIYKSQLVTRKFQSGRPGSLRPAQCKLLTPTLYTFNENLQFAKSSM